MIAPNLPSYHHDPMPALTRIYSDNWHEDEGMPRPIPTNAPSGTEKDRSLLEATEQSQRYTLPAAPDTYSAGAACFATPHFATYAPGAPVIPLNCDLSDSDDDDEMDTSRFAAPARPLRRHAPVIPPSPTSSDSDLSDDDMPDFPRQFNFIYSGMDPSIYELPSPFNKPLSVQPMPSMFEALPSPFNKPLAQFHQQETNGKGKLHTLRTRGSVLLGDMAVQRDDEPENLDYFEAPLSPLDLSDSPLSEEPWPPAW